MLEPKGVTGHTVEHVGTGGPRANLFRPHFWGLWRKVQESLGVRVYGEGVGAWRV